jgi:effector-binding domain-containing protein
MSFSNQSGDFPREPRRGAGLWRWIAVLAIVLAAGAALVHWRFSLVGQPPAVAEAQPPAAPAAQAEAPSPIAPPPAPLDLGAEPQPGAPAEAAPAESIASQASEIESRPVLVLRGKGAWADGLKTLSEAIDKVVAAAAKTNAEVTGRPLVAFTETDDNGFRFEAMLPVAKAPAGKAKLEDGVEVGASPGGKALKFQHRGPYDEIDTTYEAITAFLDEKGLDTKNLFVEEYLTDLKTGEDEGLEVDIYVFLK